MIVHRHAVLASTQVEARRLAVAGAPHGTVVVADAQTEGRGRLGRAWTSAPGENLLLSVVLRPEVPVREAPLLTLGAAAGVATALDLRVKWPNDLVDDGGHKLGGFLAELDADGERVAHVVLGLGLNVNQVAFPGLPNATSLRALRGGPQDRDEVLDTVVRAILAWSAHPDRLHLWRQRAHTLGRWVTAGPVSGLATALLDDGSLVVGGVVVTTGELQA